MNRIILILIVLINVELMAQDNFKYDFTNLADYDKEKLVAPWSNENFYEEDIVVIGDYKYLINHDKNEETLLIDKVDIEGQKRLGTKKLSLKNLPKYYVYENIIHLKGGRHYFKYSSWDRPTKTERLYIREIDIEKGIFIGEQTLFIHSGRINNIESYFNSYNTGSMYTYKFPHFLIEDSTKFLIYFKKAPKVSSNSKNIDEIEVRVYNSDLELFSKEVYFMPKVEKYLDIKKNFLINDKLVLFAQDNEKGATSSLAYFVFESGGVLKRKDFNIKDSELVSFRTIRKYNQLYLVGYTYNKSDKFKDGVFVSSIDNEFNLNSTSHTYESVYFNNYYKNKRRDFEIKSRTVTIDKEGENIILIAEAIGKVEKTSGNSTWVYRCPEDIMMTKFDFDMNHLFDVKIPKKQFGLGTTSYGYIQLAAYHYFFYVNHLDNISQSLSETPNKYSTGRDGNFEVAIIDENGKISRKALFRNQLEGSKIFPSNYIADEEGDMIYFEAEKADKKSVLRVKIH